VVPVTAVDVNVDAIPDELKDRDQWLLWDASNETPRRPHWTGDFAVSWSDPDAWHSFDDAVDAANRHESWGIGYVMAKDNDEHPRGIYGCLDLDGAVVDSAYDGLTLADWVPSIAEFIEEAAYAEFSPSGNGIHIPFVGQEVPDWWSDSQIDDHEGVDVLTNKFCTFTGDKLEWAGETVSERAPASWLFDAYKNINGETPRIAPSKDAQRNDDYDGDEPLDAGTVEEALNHLDPNCEYPAWRDLAYAVHDWDSGSQGKSLFKSWSQRGTKWDDQAERVVESIWDTASQGDGVTVGTLIHKAREAGWEFPGQTSQPPAPPESTEAPEESGGDSPDLSRDMSEWWVYVRESYASQLKHGRLAAAQALEELTNWMYVMDSETLWVYNDEKGYFSPWGEHYIASVLEDKLAEFFSQQEVNEVVARIEARNQTRRKKLDARTRDTPLLCVGNGVVDLSSGELLEHSPEYKFTRGLEWAYDPARADPEPVREFLDDITKREADRDTLLDHLAHGLMPGHPYRALVMMYGPGSNGKTRVGKLLRGFVGEENAASVELQDLTGDDSFATGSLPGAFVNVGDDISVGEIRDTSIIKSLTGDGTIRANQKYEKQYEFENEAAMFFSANEPPRIRERTDAINDRVYPIEMPYRFVDDPVAENEKQKIPGIAEGLLKDDAAMRGLLLLAVKHAQEVIDRNGEYSMPETPAERRELYEAASDPIKRFALEFFDPSDGSDAVIKTDAYTVYTEMCAAEGERPASEEVFKQQISQIASLDIESSRSRGITSGKSRDRVWRYVAFSDDATEFMPERLRQRYFGDDAGDLSDLEDDDDVAFNASPIRTAPDTLTGYVTVTAEIATVREIGETGAKAVLKDTTGAMDFVAWEDPLASKLQSLEGESVVVKMAEVDEYEGTRQLQPVDGVTEVAEIQLGVGFTQGEPTEDGQSTVDSAATDGGEATNEGEIESVKERVRTALRERYESGDTASIPDIAGAADAPPGMVEECIEKIAQDQAPPSLAPDGRGGYEIL
jgi:putative DNA primase/helicase